MRFTQHIDPLRADVGYLPIRSDAVPKYIRATAELVYPLRGFSTSAVGLEVDGVHMVEYHRLGEPIVVDPDIKVSYALGTVGSPSAVSMAALGAFSLSAQDRRSFEYVYEIVHKDMPIVKSSRLGFPQRATKTFIDIDTPRIRRTLLQPSRRNTVVGLRLNTIQFYMVKKEVDIRVNHLTLGVASYLELSRVGKSYLDRLHVEVRYRHHRVLFHFAAIQLTSRRYLGSYKLSDAEVVNIENMFTQMDADGVDKVDIAITLGRVNYTPKGPTEYKFSLTTDYVYKPVTRIVISFDEAYKSSIVASTGEPYEFGEGYKASTVAVGEGVSYGSEEAHAASIAAVGEGVSYGSEEAHAASIAAVGEDVSYGFQMVVTHEELGLSSSQRSYISFDEGYKAGISVVFDMDIKLDTAMSASMSMAGDTERVTTPVESAASMSAIALDNERKEWVLGTANIFTPNYGTRVKLKPSVAGTTRHLFFDGDITEVRFRKTGHVDFITKANVKYSALSTQRLSLRLSAPYGPFTSPGYTLASDIRFYHNGDEDGNVSSKLKAGYRVDTNTWSGEPAKAASYPGFETTKRLNTYLKSTAHPFSDLQDKGIQLIIHVEYKELTTPNINLGVRVRTLEATHTPTYVMDVGVHHRNYDARDASNYITDGLGRTSTLLFSDITNRGFRSSGGTVNLIYNLYTGEVCIGHYQPVYSDPNRHGNTQFTSTGPPRERFIEKGTITLPITRNTGLGHNVITSDTPTPHTVPKEYEIRDFFLVYTDREFVGRLATLPVGSHIIFTMPTETTLTTL